MGKHAERPGSPEHPAGRDPAHPHGSGTAATPPDPVDEDVAREVLQARLDALRREMLRLRSSRRLLMHLLEMESLRRVRLEKECARLRRRLARARIANGRGRSAVPT